MKIESAMSETETQPDTFPRQLLATAQRYAERPSVREKDLGIWQTWTWAQAAAEIRTSACGLAALGFKRGDTLAIIGDNRPRLYWAMTAAQALGGVPVPLYQDAVADEMIYVLDDAEVRFVIVEDQEQVDKLLEILPRCPRLTHIIYDDPRGMRHYTQPQLLAYDAFAEQGRLHDAAHPDFYLAEIDKGKGTDVAVMLYTSGTTGKPKGVCIAHASLLTAARGACGFDQLGPDEQVLSYLPMAWVGDHLFSSAEALVAGFTVNCPESSDTVLTDMREIGPTFFFAPPRVFESLLTTVLIRMEDAAAIKRGMFHYFMEVAKRCGVDVLNRQPIRIVDRLLYALGDLLVYGPLRNVLGMSRIHVAYTAGAAIGPDLFRFYRSIGINLKQLYGSTETCAYTCLQRDGQIKFDSVGVAAPGVELKISDDGEVLVRGPMLLKEYYKRPDATREAIDGQGYFHTGDAGLLGADGNLKIIDRAKDVGKFAGGGVFAPNYIENKLKFFPHIKEAVAFGAGRDYCAAFINIDVGSVGNWAERRNIAYSGHTDLAAKDAVYALIRECIEQVNRELAQDPQLAGSQVQRFLLLHKELDADDGELTRTRKVRRGFIADKYGPLIDALYTGVDHCLVETQVKFEDGRTGMLRADVRISEARIFVPEELKKAS
jgi:long-chain acyl-CoA synthetase